MVFVSRGTQDYLCKALRKAGLKDPRKVSKSIAAGKGDLLVSEVRTGAYEKIWGPGETPGKGSGQGFREESGEGSREGSTEGSGKGSAEGSGEGPAEGSGEGSVGEKGDAPERAGVDAEVVLGYRSGKLSKHEMLIKVALGQARRRKTVRKIK